jgi:hypothetical protein
VERLARAIVNVMAGSHHPVDVQDQHDADHIAAEYARLSGDPSEERKDG